MTWLARKKYGPKHVEQKRVRAKKFVKKAKENVFVQAKENTQDSLRGLGIACRNKTFRWLIFPSASIGVVSGALLNFKLVEWLVIAILLLIVAVAEIVNSAIEEVNDVACNERHDERVKNSKDMSSGAVFLCTVVALGVFAFFVICHLLEWPWWAHLL